MPESTHLVKKPLISEKAYWEAGRHNRYAFAVDLSATKPEIRHAVEQLYKVRVEKVATQIRKGNYFRTRFGPGKSSNWKRATVKLHKDDFIDLI